MNNGTRISRDAACSLNPLIDGVSHGTISNVAGLLEDLGAAMETLDAAGERFGASAGLVHRLAASALRFEEQAASEARPPAGSNVVALQFGGAHG